MKKKIPSLKYPALFRAGSLLLAATAANLNANDWQTSGSGYWNIPANWNGGLPNDAGGWAIGNVANGATAIVTNVVPNVSEAWVGNGANGGASNGAGNVTILPGGVLSVDNWLVVARMCCPSSIPCAQSILTVNGGTINKTGNGFIIGDSTGSITGLGGTGVLIVEANSIININGGYFSACPGGYSTATLVFKDNAAINVGNGIDFNVGDWGSGRTTAYLSDHATLTTSRLWIGRNDLSAAALWQTGGTLTGNAAGGNDWRYGGDWSGSAAAYGFHGMSGGFFNNPNNYQPGAYGLGVLYQTGGTNNESGWTSIGRFAGGYGVVRVSGGTFIHTGTGTHLILGEQGRGELTLDGAGLVDCNLDLWVSHSYGGASGMGYLNLNGGLLRIRGMFPANPSGGASYLSLNGGTIQAKLSTGNFISGLTAATIYSGNVTFDTAGNNVTVAQPLLAPVGQGIGSIGVTSGGSGYLGAPIVSISGDGVGATAVAQFDPVAGAVTNIVITCPGQGYSTATAALLGGGGTGAALANPTLVALTGGGLAKNGSGTLLLTGGNSYTGTTWVNAGELATLTGTGAVGAYSVADGAILGVTLTGAGGQFSPASVVLGNTTGSTLAFDLGASGNTIVAPLNVGALSLTGTNVITIADSYPQIGSLPLIQYASRSGSGKLVLGSLPSGVSATLVDDSANQTVWLNITSVGLPRWEGLAGGAWDIGQTTNWIDRISGLPTYFRNGSPALFDDEAMGTTFVNLGTSVQPAGILVTNNLLAYTLGGTGKISGAGGLTKNGTNALSIANSTLNDYTGPTVILGGTLAVTNLANGGSPSAIGSSSAATSNLQLSGGVLSYSGPPVTINRGYELGAANSVIDAEANLTLSGVVTADANSSLIKAGPARLTYTAAGANQLSGGSNPGYQVVAGTVLFDGSAGGQVNHNQNEFWVANTPTSGASLILSNTVFNGDSWFAIGRGNGSTGLQSTMALYNSQVTCLNLSLGFDGGLQNNWAYQTLSLNGNSTLTNVNGGQNYFGESGGSSASVYLNDNSVYNASGRLLLGANTSATGTVVMANSAQLYVGNYLSIGAGQGAAGTLRMKNNSVLVGAGDFNVTDLGYASGELDIQDNARLTVGSVYVGKGYGAVPGAIGVVNQSGGSFVSLPLGNQEFQIGQYGTGTWNQSGGTNSVGGWLSIGRYSIGTGFYNVSGTGALYQTNTALGLLVGEEGQGTLTIADNGLVVVSSTANGLVIGNTATGNGTVNLNGGTLVAPFLQTRGAGSGTINFNGGTLRAGATSSSFISGLTAVNVLAGGAVIDDGGFSVVIAQPLLSGPDGDGGLTKRGAGTLALNGINTYTNTTVVAAGTLAGTGTIPGVVRVNSGASLAAGIGAANAALTLNSAPVLNGTVVASVSKNGGVASADQLSVTAPLTYSGALKIVNAGTNALQVGDTFTLFVAPSITGSFSTITTVSAGQLISWNVNQPGPGQFTVASITSSAQPTVTVGRSGSSLSLSWPAANTGWRLLMQTNNLSKGVSPNLSDWGPVAGSQTTNQVNVTVPGSLSAEFYQLVWP